MQQALEALTMLIALRLWRSYWSEERCVLHVASDNMGTLSMLCKMQTRAASIGIVAREMALDVADAIYQPLVAEHVPGIANIVADYLSRMHGPDPPRLPLLPFLRDAAEVQPANRSRRRTLAQPTLSTGSRGRAKRKGSVTENTG